MAKRIISLDCDGCIFNNDYRELFRAGITNAVTDANIEFLERLKNENAQYDSVTLFVGSNRQSYETDRSNSIRNKTESAFIAIKKIKKYLGVKLDKFLLADLDNDSEPGTSFNAAYNSTSEEPYEDHHRWLFDEDKLALLYGQMHKAASEDETETFFDFYDDLGLVDGKPSAILETLRDYFTKYPMLIPHNTTLRLNHYNGGEVTEIISIKGTGAIDYDYYKTLHRMEQIARKTEPRVPQKHFTRYVTPSSLKPAELEEKKKSKRFGAIHRIFHPTNTKKHKHTDTAERVKMNMRMSAN